MRAPSFFRNKFGKSNFNKRAAGLLLACLFALSLAAEAEGESLQDKLDAAAKSGGKRVVLDGTYRVDKPIKLTSAHSGLKIVGKNGAKISGAKRVKDLREAGGGLWTGSVETSELENLYVNGRRAIPAESDFLYAHSPLKVKTDHAGEKINPGMDGFAAREQDVKALLSMSPQQLKNVNIDMYTVWYNSHMPLRGISKNKNGTVNLFVSNPTGLEIYKWEPYPRFKIRNSKSELDAGGEFFFDKASKTFLYKPREGEDIKTAAVEYPVLSQILLVEGDEDNPAEGISIEGVTFQYGAHFPKEGWRQSPQAQSTVDGFVNVSCARDFKMSGCVVEHCNTYGISLDAGAERATVENCVIFDAGSGGIRIGGKALPGNELADTTYGNVIRNNIVYQYGRYNKAGVGICIFTSGNNLVENNTVFDGYYSGMSVGWTWGFAPTNTQNNRIVNNRIFKIGHGVLDDMGGIYTLGNSTGSVIIGNEISDVRRHRYGGWGIYNDEGSSGLYISCNYVHDTHEDGYVMHYGMNNIVKNNIFVNGETTQVGLSRKTYKNSFEFTRNIVVYSSPAGLFRSNDTIAPDIARFDRNIYWNTNGEVSFSGKTLKQWQETGQDKNSIVANPELDATTPKNENYKKIGFRPFSTKDAGVKGEMKRKLDVILASYRFPPIVNCPPKPPWDLDFSEDFSECEEGKTPASVGAHTEKKDRDVVVMSEGGKKFLRIIDGKNKYEFMPDLNIRATTLSKKVRIVFDARLNADSNFYVEPRNGNFIPGLPSIKIAGGKLSTPGGLVALPLGKWLRFEFTADIAKDSKRGLTCDVFDGGKKVASYSSQYRAQAPGKTTVVVVSAFGEKGSFDLANIDISGANR